MSRQILAAPLFVLQAAVTALGMGLWLYGYYADGGAPVIDWPLYLPDWAAAYVPNWVAELGFAISLIGMSQIYYAEFIKLKVSNP